MTQLIIASDGSDNARTAQDFVTHLPFPEQPDARLVAVTPLPVMLSEYYVEDVLFQQASHIQKTAVSPREVANAERLKPFFSSVTTDLRIGDPANELMASANEHQGDVIVLGARGLSAIPRFLMGSVSDYVCRHARQSVLVVRTRPHATDVGMYDPAERPRKILFAVDGSPASDQAIDRLAKWKWPADTVARIITAHQRIEAFGFEIIQADEPYRTAERLKSEAILESAAQRLKTSIPHVETAICESIQIAHTIVEEAEKWHADLLVIGNRGMGRWERFLLGSTSLGVLHHAPCSVWMEKVSG